MQARVLAGGLRTRGTRVVCGAQRSTLLVCGDRLGWAGSGSTVGDAAAACSALVFFLGGAFFAAGALRLGAILSSGSAGLFSQASRALRIYKHKFPALSSTASARR